MATDFDAAEAELLIASVEAEFRRRRADEVGHARGSLAEHLRGTHAVLGGWNQPEHVERAGLLHSAYSTEAFAYQLFGTDERSRVRELIGTDAERLVYLFCALERREVATAATSGAAIDHRLVQLTDRWNGCRITVGAEELSSLLILYIANAAEQTCSKSGAPTRWLRSIGQLARLAAALDAPLPSALQRCSTISTTEEEALLLSAYRELTTVPPDEAIESTPDAEHPVVGEPLVYAGLRSLAAGDLQLAASRAGTAQELLQAWGTPWDKRLSLGQWSELCSFTRRASERPSRAAVIDRTRVALADSPDAPEHLYELLDRSGLLEDGRSKRDRPSSLIGRAVRTP